MIYLLPGIKPLEIFLTTSFGEAEHLREKSKSPERFFQQKA